MKIQNLDSLKSITWSELGKQNIQAKKVYHTLCSYIAVIHMVKKLQYWRGKGALGQDNKGNYQYEIMIWALCFFCFCSPTWRFCTTWMTSYKWLMLLFGKCWRRTHGVHLLQESGPQLLITSSTSMTYQCFSSARRLLMMVKRRFWQWQI